MVLQLQAVANNKQILRFLIEWGRFSLSMLYNSTYKEYPAVSSFFPFPLHDLSAADTEEGPELFKSFKTLQTTKILPLLEITIVSEV